MSDQPGTADGSIVVDKLSKTYQVPERERLFRGGTQFFSGSVIATCKRCKR
jgi:hypothetical protein